MGTRIKTGDLVKIISGNAKGTTGKITKVLPREGLAFVEGVGQRTRHLRPTPYQKGGKKDIQTGIALSKLALVVDEKTKATSRVAYTKSADGKTVRLARQANNREIK